MPVIGELKTLITGNSDSLERAARKGRVSLGKFDLVLKKNRTSMASSAASMVKLSKRLVALGAAYLTARKAASLLGDAIKRAGKEELAQKVFGNFFGEEGIGKALDAQLRSLAVKSPFQLEELREGASMLAAFVDNSRELVPTIEMLGDLAAGTNSNFMDLARTWARNSQLTKQQTRDIREWGNRGINLNEQMGIAMGKTQAQIMEMVKEGKIGFDDVNDALESMVENGGKFEDFMAKMSDTLPGRISNLGDAFANTSSAIGTWVSEIVGLSEELEKLTTGLEIIEARLRNFNEQRERADKFDKSEKGKKFNKLIEDTREPTVLEMMMGKKPAPTFGEVSAEFHSLSLLGRLTGARGDARFDEDQLRNTRATQQKAVELAKFAKEQAEKERRALEPPTLQEVMRKKLAGGVVSLGSSLMPALLGAVSGGARGLTGLNAAITAGMTRLDMASGGMAGRPGGPAFAGAAERGSAEATRILAGAAQSPAVKEAKRHTGLLTKMDRSLVEISRAVGAGVPGVIGSLLGHGSEG